MVIADRATAADKGGDIGRLVGRRRQRRRRLVAAITVEEIARRHVERPRREIEPARREADAGGLIFLHRLEGDADPVAQLALAHAELEATPARARADMAVDRMRPLARRFIHLMKPPAPCPAADR